MAWSAASLSVEELAARALDLPMLIGLQAGDSPLAFLPIWSNGSGTMVETNREDTDGPAYYGIDRSGWIQTTTNTTATTWWYVLDATRPTNSFDCIAILNHNLDDFVGITVRVDVADNATFSTNLITGYISFTNVTADRHLALASLTRLSGGGYIRIRLQHGGSFAPIVGEFWIGRTRQLRSSHKPGGDIQALRSRIVVSDGAGAGIGLANSIGSRALSLSYTPRDDAAGLLDSDTLRSWWAECGYGSMPFLFVPNPATAPHSFLLMRSEDRALSLERKDFADRTVNFHWLEQTPFISGAG